MQGSFEDVRVNITLVSDDSSQWTIDAEEVTYEIHPNGNVTLHIVNRHMDVKVEPEEQATPRSDGGIDGMDSLAPTISTAQPLHETRSAEHRDGSKREAIACFSDDVHGNPARKRRTRESAHRGPSRTAAPSGDAQHRASGDDDLSSTQDAGTHGNTASSSSSSSAHTAASPSQNKDTHQVCVVEGCTRPPKGKVAKNDRYGSAGPRCARHLVPAQFCSVEGCAQWTRGKVTSQDRHGGPGTRCARHGAPLPQCNVEGCAKGAKSKVRKRDAYGAAGDRCVLHGTSVSAPQCNVEGCVKWSQGRVEVQDVHGHAGKRCHTHGAPSRRCNVEGCGKPSRCRIAKRDEYGPVGYRCGLHGARWCNVEGCKKLSARKASDNNDQHGHSGRRCFHHGALARRCNVEGCGRLSQSKASKSDGYGGPGRRCSDHRIPAVAASRRSTVNGNPP
eukprot:GEMP01040068.1.p1 GENE.GEMP01040068.1~~GEMP01040068.1.p1  ORF type:complete len:446 (-),score=127.80 GEMP01040068.1:403-1740(-)